MAEFTYDSVHDSMFGLRDAVLADGSVVAPRGQRTYELRNVMVHITDPTDVLCTGMGRFMNTGLAAIETLQLIGGFSDPQLMARIAPNTTKFQDGGYFHGAYGPRLRPQISPVLRRLRLDSSSRQAVATIWDPLHDLMVSGSNDYPCTVYLSWVIREGKLEQTTHMRSNDLWWGWTYDAVQFTQLQNSMARCLGVESGTYHHYVDSFHVYERDIPMLADLHERDVNSHDPVRLNGICGFEKHPRPPWEETANFAEDIAHHPSLYLQATDPTAAWLAAAIFPKTKES